MRILLILSSLCLTTCSYLASQVPHNPDQVKSNVMKLIEGQRAKKDWMKDVSCLADAIPKAVTGPKLSAKDCAGNPSKCLNLCDSNDGDSCYSLAQLIQQHDTIENDVAQILYRRSCRAGIVSGCTNAAATLFELKDETAIACGAGTFEIACARNDPWACTMNGLALGEGIGRAKNVVEANRSFDKACEVSTDKNGQACIKAKELKAALARLEN